MNIYCKPGHKVLFTGKGVRDPEYFKDCLFFGKVYTVKRTTITPWITSVELEERPGRTFNSVMFDDANGVNRAMDIILKNIVKEANNE